MIHVVYLAHESPGRLRLRLPALRKSPESAESLADHVSKMQGVEEVQVRPYTGSILCTFDRHVLRAEQIVAAVREHTGATTVLRPGERSEEEERVLAEEALRHGTDLARSVAAMFKGLNLEMLRATNGRVDLGMTAALTFAGAGVAEVLATGKLPMPPWFNLGWWAYRMFMTTEQTAIENAPADVPPPAHADEEVETGVQAE